MAHSKWSCQHCVLLKTVREWSCSVLGLLCMPWSSGAVEQWQGPPALCGPDSSLIAGSSPTLPQLCFPPPHTHTHTHTLSLSISHSLSLSLTPSHTQKSPLLHLSSPPSLLSSPLLSSISPLLHPSSPPSLLCLVCS